MTSARRRNPAVSLLVLLGCATLALGNAAIADGEKKIKLDYSRKEARSQTKRERASRKTLPRELRIEAGLVGAEKPGEAAKGSARGRHANPKSQVDPPRSGPYADRRPTRETEIYRHARSAAIWTADRFVERVGRSQYFRVGFHEGMLEGLNDPAIGDRDFREAERRGWRDFEARSVGAEIGETAARTAAERNAEVQVVEQFSNLGALPDYLPRPGRPGFVPTLPYVSEPTLDEVFADFPLIGFRYADRRVEAFLENWAYDAARLYRTDAYANFFDAGWRDANAAFRFWKNRHEQSAYYRSLTNAQERHWFEEKFGEVFVQRVAALYPKRLLPAFEQGLDEGWSYGAFVHQELDYRQGFRAGFVSGLEDAAQAGFDRSYMAIYAEAYRASFDEWSRNPKPEIVDVWLLDGNRDGVFEPGEELRVDYEVINYGGGRGRLPLRLEGSVLERSGHTIVDLPARSVTRADEMLSARIAPRTPTRTNAELALILAGQARELPLRVSYPLQLRRGAWRVRRSNLEGEVVLEVDVENQSRLALEGHVELTTGALPGFVLSKPLGILEAGVVRRLALPVTGLDPLELIAGWVSLDVAVFGRQVRQDAFTYNLPDAARDLSNPDLLSFTVALAREDQVSRSRVSTTRDLLITRLREDWKVAVAGRNNPYKFDYRHDAATTALGDLVRTFREQEPAVREHEVFDGLSTEVLTLAKRLPGIHPYLRKYMRKLAGELP